MLCLLSYLANGWLLLLPLHHVIVLLPGSHPFYLQANRDGFSHGVLFLSSNGMDVLLNETSLTYK